MTENNEDIQNEFDDDDFGDFEEASAAPVKATTSIEEPDDPFPASPRTETQFGFAKFDEKIQTDQCFESFIPCSEHTKSLPELLDDSSLWEFEDSAASSLVERDESIADFFEHFDTGKFPEETPNLPDHYLKALKLWSEICFVEDTPALKLQWNKTVLYSGLLSTLNMNPAKAVPREKPVVPVMIPTSAPLELPNHDRLSKIQPSQDIQQNEIAPGTSSVESQQSGFEWQSTSTSNTITGACISDFSSILDLDFDSNRKSTKDNELEKELERLGLGRTEETVPDTQDLSFGNNSLNFDEILRPTTGRIGNGNLTELSADARSLLEALPDYGHMLSRMLMFPVKR